ncbi:hypothetical protein GCM10007276_35960 [Agaricicola taiwanensis]|uniref:Uncharacterized protein n=1 Tax=Agaricicola taiwanensis TaxID=591372 RepID=A0A8J2YNN0_9RHOB|nr:hypothetical protein GCM10007276_35960 [Agaricicola taiwanensis]
MTAAKGKHLTVRATAVGYHGGRLREVGEVFGYALAAGARLPRWVVAVRRGRKTRGTSSRGLALGSTT